MNQLQAYAISIGVLGGIDTFLTATVFPVPVYVTFIAWASFFIMGGKLSGLGRSIASNLTGCVIASLTLLAITGFGGSTIITSVCVGVGSAAMVLVSRFKLLSAVPAIVWGFASTVATTVATGKSITTQGLDNPFLVAAAALILGGVFGYIHEVWGNAMVSKATPVSSQEIENPS